MEVNTNDLNHFNEQFKKIVKDIAYILSSIESKNFLDPNESFKMVEDIKALLYGVSDNASCKYLHDANYFQIIRYFIENKMAITFSFINKANAIKDTESLEFVKQKLELLTALEQNMRMFAMLYNIEKSLDDIKNMFDNHGGKEMDKHIVVDTKKTSETKDHVVWQSTTKPIDADDMRHMFDDCDIDDLRNLDLSKFDYNTYKDKGDNK